MDVRGKTILVTGAGQGIGRSMAVHFARKGANLALLDTNAQSVKETQAHCTQLGVVARSYVASAANEDSVVGALDRVTADFGGLDGLINNAGIVRDGMLVKVRDGQVVGKLTLAEWQAVIDVNLTGATLIARDVVAKMAETGQKGVVVNISSIARHGNRGQSNYSAAKAALAANTKTWAQEFAGFGIRVGAIAPGMVETPMTQGMNQKARDALVAAIPVGRIGLVEDLWLAVKFVLECDYFDGRTIDVDGGLSM